MYNDIIHSKLTRERAFPPNDNKQVQREVLIPIETGYVLFGLGAVGPCSGIIILSTSHVELTKFSHVELTRFHDFTVVNAHVRIITSL